MKLKNCLFIMGLLPFILSHGQLPGIEQSIHDLVKKQTEAIYDSLVIIRRDIHMNPELPGQEKMTSEKIAAYLESLGLEVRKKIGGHDVHTVIGLGIASVLARNRERLTGTVYFIFQPSEENYGGAKAMIDDGLFSIISPDEIYGLHVNPMPAGMISAKPDLVYAYLKIIRVSYKNQDDTQAVADFTRKTISRLQAVRSDSTFWDSRSLGDPVAGIANPNTIYRDYLAVDKNFDVELRGKNLDISVLLIGTNKEQLDSIPSFVEKQILRSQYASSLKSVSYVTEYPTVINDGDLTAKSLNSILSVYGQNIAVPLHGVIPVMNDDFAYFQQKIPGVYYFLGGSNYQKGIVSMPHSPDFNVDEECIISGVRYFSSIIANRLTFK